VISFAILLSISKTADLIIKNSDAIGWQRHDFSKASDNSFFLE
jgi:hypothetical protein